MVSFHAILMYSLINVIQEPFQPNLIVLHFITFLYLSNRHGRIGRQNSLLMVQRVILHMPFIVGFDIVAENGRKSGKGKSFVTFTNFFTFIWSLFYNFLKNFHLNYLWLLYPFVFVPKLNNILYRPYTDFFLFLLSAP